MIKCIKKYISIVFCEKRGYSLLSLDEICLKKQLNRLFVEMHGCSLIIFSNVSKANLVGLLKKTRLSLD